MGRMKKKLKCSLLICREEIKVRRPFPRQKEKPLSKAKEVIQEKITKELYGK